MYGSDLTCAVDAQSVIEEKVCDICGDPGYEEMLAICTECSERAEHLYCMQTLMEAVPKNDWFCECCKLQKEVKLQDLPSSLLQSRTGSSNLVKPMNSSQDNQSPTLLGVEKSKVIFIKHAGLDDLTSAMPAGIVSDAPKVLKKIPNIGGSASMQQSVGLSESPQILSKKIALKVPKVKTLTTISSLADTSTAGIGTVNNAGCLSRKSSTTVAISSPQKGSVPLGSPKNNCELSSSLSTKAVGVAENPKRHEGAMPVSCPTSASGSFLQSRPAKRMVSHRSLYEDLPSFLLSSKPPKLPKRQVPPSFLFSSKPPKIPKRQVPHERAPGGVYSQVRQKFLAGSSLPTYATHPKKYVSQKSTDPHHSDSTEISVNRNIDIDKVPEHKLLPDTSYVDPFSVDQKMCRSTNVGQVFCAGIPPAENTGSTNTCGDPCAVDSQKQTVKAPLEMLVETSAGLKACHTEPKATKEGTSMLPETAKFGAKLCVRSSYNEDGSKLMEIETNINPVTAGCTVSVQNIDTMVVAIKDSILEREDQIAHMAGTSEIKGMDEEKQLPKRAPLSRCSDFVPSLDRIRRYKRQEMAHSTQKFCSYSNSCVLHLPKPEGSTTANKLNLENVRFGCVDATINAAGACRAEQKFLEPVDIPNSLVGEDFSAETINPSNGRLSNLESLQMQENKMKLLDFRVCQEAAIRYTSCNTTLEKASFLEKDKDDRSIIGDSDVCKPHITTSLESYNPLKCRKFDNGLAAQTEGKNLENIQSFSKQLSDYTTSIVVPETLSMQADRSRFMKAPDMASCVPMPLLPAGESGCLNIADARKSSSEKIDSDAENMRRTTMLFPSHVFGVTGPRVPATPELYHLWRGGFQVAANGKPSLLYDGIVAHASSRAMDKVYHATRGFPSVLQLEEVQRGDATDSWPMQFMKKPPNDESIALYFFATNNHSFDQYYRRLLDHMVVHDVALKGVTDTAELLVFPSSLLPKQFQCWNQLMFIWGVFRGRKRFKMENMSDTPRSVHPDLGGLLSLKPHVAKESITEMLPVANLMATSNMDVAGEEDMDVDMEGGKEVGIADRPVKRPVASNPDPISSEVEIPSAFPQVSHAQQVPKALKQDTSNEIPAFTVSANNPFAPRYIADLCHSHEKVNKSGELDLPPGFGPPPHAAISPDQPPAFENCNKISDKNSCHGLSTASAHASSRGNKEGSVKRSYAKTQQSPPSSPKERVHSTGHLESRSHRHRHSSSGSELSRFHKRRKKHENLSDRDQLDRSKYDERAKCWHFQSTSSYRREPAYRVDKEMERRNTRDYGGRYWVCDKKNYETRAHTEIQADYHSEKRKLSRGTIYARRDKKSYSCGHSRLPSQSHSHSKKRDRSPSPCYNYGHKSEICVSRHGSGGSGMTFPSFSHGGDFAKLQQSEVKRGESQGVTMGIQADLKRELGIDPIKKGSSGEPGSFTRKVVIHGIKGGAVEVKDKTATSNCVPLKVTVTDCDSSYNDLAMTESVTKELNSENKQILQSSKVTPVHLFTQEEASQDLTIVSEISSVAEESFSPCFPPVVTVVTCSQHAEPGVEQLETSRHLSHSAGKIPCIGAEIFEDKRTSVAPTLELTLGGNESSAHQVEPFLLFRERVGLMKEKYDCRSSYQSAPSYAAKCSSTMRGKFELYGICENKFDSLNLTLAVPGGTSMGGHAEDSQLKAVGISLKL